MNRAETARRYRHGISVGAGAVIDGSPCNLHQSIFIMKINITYTIPNHHHNKPIQLKHFNS